MAEQQKQTALVKRETVDSVMTKVKQFQDRGELFFPTNYVPENALKSAWLVIQETQDRNKKPALSVCSKESIANALLSMVIQGLNPDKKQCYFIVYGTKLVMQRSYFGAMAVAKSADETIEELYPMVIYEGDKFKYTIKRGKKILTEHEQDFANVDKSKIVGAYCNVVRVDGSEELTVMTLAEIKQSWKKSQMNPVDEKGNIKKGSTHDEYMADMCMKTVINKACKLVINASDDSNIVVNIARQNDVDNAEAEAEAEIEENANTEVIDVEYEQVEEVPDIPEEDMPEVFKEQEEKPKTKSRGF